MKRESRYYFDHNATAVPQSTLPKGLLEILSEGPLNPSSVHTFGRLAKSRLEAARRALAAEIGGQPEELRFTSGATEAIFDFMEGFLAPGDEVLVNPLEHPAIFGALAKVGVSIRYMEIDSYGRILLEKLSSQVTQRTKLVVVMKAQNEIGNLYPVKEISALVAPVPVFCDTVQAFGKVPVDVVDLGVAGASFSAHKIGGLSGSGALWVKRDFDLKPRTTGGSQERGERGGTENLIGIESFRLAIDQLKTRVLAQEKLAKFRNFLRARLANVVGFQCLGDPNHCLANTLFFRVDGVPGDLIIQAMDLEGFALSTGSACSSGSIEPSRTLLALGCSVAEAKEGVRISMGPETTEESVELLAKILVDKLNEFSPKYGSSQ